MRTPFALHLRRLYNQALASQSQQNPVEPLANILSRRQFLIGTAGFALTASPLMHALAQTISTPTKKSGESVAVIGAGMAGLSAAYELSKLGFVPKLYEASARVGGRMFTVQNFNDDKMSVELGGEFVDTNHYALIGLCKEFGLPLDPYAKEDKGLEQNLYYFQKQYYTDADALRAFRPIVAQIKADVAELKKPQGIAKFDHISLDRYLQKFNGKTEAWFLNTLRIGGLAEGGLEANQMPAIYMLWVLGTDTSEGFKLYGDSDQAFFIRGGTTSLISAMQKALSKRGIEVQMLHQLVAIRDTGTKIKLTFQTGGATKEEMFDRVICTVPFTVLRDVEGIRKLDLHQKKLDCIQNVHYSPAGKMILGYKSRLWRHGITSPNGKKIPPSNGMVYSDLAIQNTWEASRTQKGTSGILTNFVGANEGRNLSGKDQARYASANNEIFPGLESKSDKKSAVWNWHQNPQSRGAYSTLQVGDVTRFQKTAYQPELNGRLHFAGEHATEKSPGYMNGAAHSGIRAAKAIVKK